MVPDSLLRLFLRHRWRGFETLHRLAGRRRIVARCRYGARFTLDPHDYIDSIVLREGFYESEVFEALRSNLAPGAVFWDIGCCFGLHAVTLATTVPGLDVHAFEPNPPSQELIRQNAQLNGVTLRLWPLALDEHDGASALHVPASGNRGMATLRPTSVEAYDGNCSVETARAATLLASGRAPMPNVIKLDVEGSEIAVLRGFGPYLADPRLRAIVFEAGPDVLSARSDDPVRRLVLAAGFELLPLERNEQSSHLLINVLAHRR